MASRANERARARTLEIKLPAKIRKHNANFRGVSVSRSDARGQCFINFIAPTL